MTVSRALAERALAYAYNYRQYNTCVLIVCAPDQYDMWRELIGMYKPSYVVSSASIATSNDVNLPMNLHIIIDDSYMSPQESRRVIELVAHTGQPWSSVHALLKKRAEQREELTLLEVQRERTPTVYLRQTSLMEIEIKALPMNPDEDENEAPSVVLTADALKSPLDAVRRVLESAGVLVIIE